MKKYQIVDCYGSVWNVGSYEFIYDMFLAFDKLTVLEYELKIQEV